MRRLEPSDTSYPAPSRELEHVQMFGENAMLRLVELQGQTAFR